MKKKTINKDPFNISDPDVAERLIKRLEDDPIYFIEVFLGRELSDKQRTFIKKTKNHNHIIAIWSRQTGKSTVIASYILWRLLYGKGKTINKEWMPEKIAIVAPIRDQIKNLYDKIKTLVDKSEFIAAFITKLNTEIITAKNGNEAKFLSASPGSQIRGYTATCIVIDESQDITDSKYNADILPFGATTNALIIEAGTPKTKNHFYQATQSKDILTIKQPWFECPFLSEEYVMRQRETSPEPLWRQEYLCEFMEEGVLVFPSRLFEPELSGKQPTGRWNLAEYEYITKIEEFTHEKAQEVYKSVQDGATYRAGLDLGKSKDNTVFTILRDDIRPIRVEAQIEFPLGTPYTEIARKVALLYKVYQPYEWNVDYSNEKSFIDILIENEIPVVQDGKNIRGAIAFTNKNKSEMISTAQILLENYAFQLPKKAELLLSQFLNQQFEITGSGIYRYFHPSNEHDDHLWSTLLALKNITLSTATDQIKFQNPWEKYDEQVHGDAKKSAKEVLLATSKYRGYGKNVSEKRRSHRYIPADLRRAH